MIEVLHTKITAKNSNDFKYVDDADSLKKKLKDRRGLLYNYVDFIWLRVKKNKIKCVSCNEELGKV